jgi:hypothetical protein
MSTAKQDVELLLNRLPDDSSFEDIQYHLYVLDKVRGGLEDAGKNGARRALSGLEGFAHSIAAASPR